MKKGIIIFLFCGMIPLWSAENQELEARITSLRECVNEYIQVMEKVSTGENSLVTRAHELEKAYIDKVNSLALYVTRLESPEDMQYCENQAMEILKLKQTAADYPEPIEIQMYKCIIGKNITGVKL